MLLQYSVVIFTEGRLQDSVVVVPTSWLLEKKTKTYWPIFSTGKATQRQRLIVGLAEPLTDTWPIQAIKFCHSYKTWTLAQDAAKLQTKQDDTVSSAGSGGRGKRPKFRSTRLMDSNSSDDDTGPPKEVKKKKSGKHSTFSPKPDVDKSPDRDKIKALLAANNNRNRSKVGSSRFTTDSVSLTKSTPQESKKTSVTVSTPSSGTLESKAEEVGSVKTPVRDRQKNKKSIGTVPTQSTGPLTSKINEIGTIKTPIRDAIQKPKETTITVNKKTIGTVPTQSKGTLESEIHENGSIDTLKRHNMSGGTSVNDKSSSTIVSDTSPLLDKGSTPKSRNILSESEKEEEDEDSETPNNTNFLSDDHHENVSDDQIQITHKQDSQLHSNRFDEPGGSKSSSNSNNVFKSKKDKSSGRKSSVPTMKSKISDLSSSRHSEMRVVGEILGEISSKLDFQGMNIAKILQCCDPEGAVVEMPEGFPHLPFKTEADLNKFEKFLEVPTNFTASSLYLSGKLMGQTVPYKGAQFLLREMISNNLSRIISWEGSKGEKIPFRKTNSLEVLLSAILRRFSDKHMGLVQEKIKRWFSSSQGRSPKEKSQDQRAQETLDNDNSVDGSGESNLSSGDD